MRIKGKKLKRHLVFILYILIISTSVFSVDLSKLYKNGKAEFIIDDKFGKTTEWDILFPRGIRSMAFKKDGSFFAVSSKNHCVYYFSKKGKLKKKIGQKGEGPGDFYHPGKISILDNKYLIVGEYATKRRISVFDLNGKFTKVLRAKARTCFAPTAISKGAIAYWSLGKTIKKGKYDIGKRNLFIKDIHTGKEKRIKASFEMRSKRLKGQGMMSIHTFTSDIFLHRIGKNKILCSFSSDPDIYICSLKGNVIKSFRVAYKRKKVPDYVKNTVYKFYLKKTKNGFFNKVIKRMWRNGTLIKDYYPYYRKITLDPESNILIFKTNEGASVNSENDLVFGDSNLRFLSYSSSGEFIGKYKIDFSENKSIFFTPSFFFGNAVYSYHEEEGLQRILLYKN